MIRQKINLLIVILSTFVIGILNLNGQENPEGRVMYTPDFKFKEGIYSNFQLVKNNTPVPKTRIVTDVDLFARDFYDQITEQKKIIFYDDYGVQQELNSSKIWGYGRNGVLYVNLAGNFHRISFMGSICHFVATITTYNSGYYDPYYQSNYNYSRYNRNPTSNYSNTEVKQYLFDFESGKLMEFQVSAVEILLMKDPELYDEYVTLKKKKKKQLKFVYIRKYNEKHPLYFPK